MFGLDRFTVIVKLIYSFDVIWKHQGYRQQFVPRVPIDHGLINANIAMPKDLTVYSKKGVLNIIHVAKFVV